MTITDWQSFDQEKISIFKPFQINKDTYKAFLNYDKTHIIVQTTKTIIFNKPKQYNNILKLSICFFDYEFNNNTRNFVNFLLKIEKYIKNSKKKLNSYINKLFINSKFKPSIKYSNNNNNVFMELHIEESQLSVFNLYKEKECINYIVPNSYLFNIIQIDSIWITEKKYGIKWKLIQTKVYPPLNKLSKCIIEDPYDNEPYKHYFNDNILHNKNNVESEPVNNEDHEIYGKYFKMKRLKIPIERIFLKIKLDGLDVSDFKNIELGKKIKIRDQVKLNEDLQNKRNNLNTIKNIKKYVKKIIRRKSFIPSVNEILRIRSKLKNIK